MRRAVPPLALLCLAASSSGQSAAADAPSFEVASVKASKVVAGRDGNITTDPGRFVARNATLKRLIFEAWQVPYSQITGGPAWLNTDEYDIEAKADSPASLSQLRLMLRALLIARFKLEIRTEQRESRVYALVITKNGPKLPQTANGNETASWKFHGDMSEFSNVLAIQLTIPLLDDPGTPSRARGAPIPVVNRTGIEGVYDIGLRLRPDQGTDPFTIWQRALEDQLGLRLESQKAMIDVLVIAHAERVPTGN